MQLRPALLVTVVTRVKIQSHRSDHVQRTIDITMMLQYSNIFAYESNEATKSVTIGVRPGCWGLGDEGQFLRDSRYTFENFTTYTLLVKK